MGDRGWYPKRRLWWATEKRGKRERKSKPAPAAPDAAAAAAAAGADDEGAGADMIQCLVYGGRRGQYWVGGRRRWMEEGREKRTPARVVFFRELRAVQMAR